jgi:hypothetical protein
MNELMNVTVVNHIDSDTTITVNSASTFVSSIMYPTNVQVNDSAKVAITVGETVIQVTSSLIGQQGIKGDTGSVGPQEADHTLSVNDGILLVSGGGDPFLGTTGDYVVRINYQQPVQAITVNTAGGGGSSYTLEQIADAVWSSASRSLTQKVASPSDVIAAVFAK